MTKEEKLQQLILKCSKKIVAQLSYQLNDLPIGYGQLYFLKTICENPGINQELLSAMEGSDKTTTARAIAKLEKEAYVKRTKSKEDKRMYQLNATTKGKAIIPKYNAITKSQRTKLFKKLSKSDKKVLLKAFSKMDQRLERS